MKLQVLILGFIAISVVSSAQDWEGIKVPADAGDDMVWELQEDLSDDFNYTLDPPSQQVDFGNGKWYNWYHNTWTGPGATHWQHDHVSADGNELILKATRSNNTSKYNKPGINAACVTSKNRVKYPVYIEARAKIMNSVLANGLWMLSPDDTQEIDFMEGYGSTFSEGALSDYQNQTWFAERMHMSHHVFIRNPFTDWQPSDNTSAGNPTWITVQNEGKNILWRDDYHRYGVYWKDPWHLYYYIDGVLVTKKEGKNEIDPVFHTNASNPGDTQNDTRTGLSKEMDILFSVEDQDWRTTNGVSPTDNELANTENHKLRIDWIRIYKPVEGEEEVISSLKEKLGGINVYPNPVKDIVHIEGSDQLDSIEIADLNGKILQKKDVSGSFEKFHISTFKNGIYMIKILFDNGSYTYKKLVKN